MNDWEVHALAADGRHAGCPGRKPHRRAQGAAQWEGWGKGFATAWTAVRQLGRRTGTCCWFSMRLPASAVACQCSVRGCCRPLPKCACPALFLSLATGAHAGARQAAARHPTQVPLRCPPAAAVLRFVALEWCRAVRAAAPGHRPLSAAVDSSSGGGSRASGCHKRSQLCCQLFNDHPRCPAPQPCKRTP